MSTVLVTARSASGAISTGATFDSGAMPSPAKSLVAVPSAASPFTFAWKVKVNVALGATVNSPPQPTLEPVTVGSLRLVPPLVEPGT
ncbi:hypothetical protein [Kitasatospora sp. MMS16-BH015]|uniref:hypothetical protein n=1 Tax=Kitasatospora sp. MMS16-BH015 TaxID=2018025 RepID=UPI0020C26F4D|nr:hypothetical protein [Kitasatospora sp. MMS16-BH015]